MTIFNIISLFGGLALFLYGMRLMGNGLKSGSTATLKKIMTKVTNTPFIGFLLGLGVTAVIQSSTATIVLTSGLVGAGIITLRQSIGIILGANVGTTVTGQIIRLLDIDSGAAAWLTLFKPSTLAPIAAIIGILLIMAVRTRNSDIIGDIAMGFGILFTGLLNMTAAVSPLSESATFSQMFITMSENPLLGFAIGTGVAFLIQSSSATIGILQALSVTGALSFSSVYAIIIGVNIGDCVTTAIVCSIGSKADAKRTGMIHILFNLAASVLVIGSIILLKHFGVLDSIWDTTITSGGIANAHTLFRLAAAIVLLPVCTKFENLSRKIIKDDVTEGENVDSILLQLNEKLFSSPALALASVQNAISAMANIANKNVTDAFKILDRYDANTARLIDQAENDLDALTDNVDDYIFRLTSHVPSGHGDDSLNYFIQCFKEFERIGDHAVNMMEGATDMDEKHIHFSPVAKKEIGILSTIISELLNHTYKAFTELDGEAARHIEPLEEVVDDLIAALKANHIRRLNDGHCSIYAGTAFLDILVDIERISDRCSNLGIYTLASINATSEKQHDYIMLLHDGKDAQFNEEYKQMHDKYFSMLSQISASSCPCPGGNEISINA